MKIGVIKHLQEKSFFEQIPLIKVKESFEDKDLPLEERTKKFRIITTKNSNTYTTAIWDEEKVSERGCSPLENPDYLFEAKITTDQRLANIMHASAIKYLKDLGY